MSSHHHLFALIGISLLSVTCVYQGLSSFHAVLQTFPLQEGATTLPQNTTNAEGFHGIASTTRVKEDSGRPNVLHDEFFLPIDSSSADEPPTKESGIDSQPLRPRGSRPTVLKNEFFLPLESSSTDEPVTIQEETAHKESRALKEARPKVLSNEFFLPPESSSTDEPASAQKKSRASTGTRTAVLSNEFFLPLDFSSTDDGSSNQDSRTLGELLPLVVDNEVDLDTDTSITLPAIADPISALKNIQSQPILVFHIGPHKTATSTIQCELTHDQNFLHERGNFTYLGREYPECKGPARPKSTFSIDTRMLVRCLDHHSEEEPCHETSVWKEFDQALADLARGNQNVLISDEAFSRLKLSNSEKLELLLSTLQKHFHLRVIIYYRHYHSWFLSQYNEHYKPLSRREIYRKWPGEGGKRIKTFVEFYRQYKKEVGVGSYETAAAKGNYQYAADRMQVHPAVYLQKRWTDPALPSAVKDVRIINMHEDEGGVTYQFIGQALSPELAQIYYRHKQRQNSGTPALRKNPSLNLDFDILTVAAREQHLFPREERFERRRVAYFTEKVLQKNANTSSLLELPHVCLDGDKMQQFLNHSLEMERTVFQGSIRSQLEQDFMQEAEKLKFCNLDTAKLLNYTNVQKMFQSLTVLATRSKGGSF
jgi:hypothetical protein